MPSPPGLHTPSVVFDHVAGGLLQDGGDTGRSGLTSNADSVFTGDWKPHNIDVAPPKPRDAAVPPLWKKGEFVLDSPCVEIDFRVFESVMVCL